MMLLLLVAAAGVAGAAAAAAAAAASFYYTFFLTKLFLQRIPNSEPDKSGQQGVRETKTATRTGKQIFF